MHVVRALERAGDGHAAVVPRDRDHRVVLDVELLLVAHPVFALEDHVGGRHRGVDLAGLDVVVGERVVRSERVEDRRKRFGAHGDRLAGGAQGRLVGRGQEEQRLRVVLDLAAERDEDRLVRLDGADDVVAGDVRRGDDHDRGPVERRVLVDGHEPGVGVGRADRRAVPGARHDDVVGVERGAGQLGGALPTRRGATAGPSRHGRPGRHDQRSGRFDTRGHLVGRPSSTSERTIGEASRTRCAPLVTGPHRMPLAVAVGHRQSVPVTSRNQSHSTWPAV